MATAQTSVLFAKRTKAVGRLNRRLTVSLGGIHPVRVALSPGLRRKANRRGLYRYPFGKASSLSSADFWRSKETWRRARINTLRCLVGCTLGDLSAMWFLQSDFAGLGTGLTMGLSSKPSLSTGRPPHPCIFLITNGSAS